MKLIHAAIVVRDKLGFWSHPDEPDFDEDVRAYKAWIAAQGLETTYASLESEDDDHPAYKAYYDDDSDGSIHAWNPPAPDGEGWFTLSIHDSEDGPFWVWARRRADFSPAEAL